jgi:hypothetical protein
MVKLISVLAVTAIAALCGTQAIAQSDRMDRASTHEQRASRTKGPYSFIGTVGYPQEWHPSRVTNSNTNRSIAPRRTVTLRPASTSSRTSGRPTSHAHQTPRGGSAYSSYVSTDRELPPAITGSARTRRATAARSDYGQLPPTTRTHSRPQLRAVSTRRSNSRPDVSETAPEPKRDIYHPYAFMDTVGFPQEYNAGSVRHNANETGRARTTPSRPNRKSRSRLEPGYEEGH